MIVGKIEKGELVWSTEVLIAKHGYLWVNLIGDGIYDGLAFDLVVEYTDREIPFASELPDQWPSKYDVPLDKTWIIKFNAPVKTDGLDLSELIVVTDAQGEKVPVEILVVDDNATVRVNPPVEGYQPGQVYNLEIKDQMSSNVGVFLKKPSQMQFITAGDYERSKEDIIARWRELKPTFEGYPYIEEPRVAAPYSPGKLKPEYIQDGINALNFFRYLAGVSDDIVVDENLSQKAQYGAVLNTANDEVDHTPPKPEDMDEDFYQKGYEGTSTSNIATAGFCDTVDVDYSTLAGYCNSPIMAIEMCIADNDTPNHTRLGHRASLLDPKNKKAGLGFAYKECKTEEVNWIHGYILVPVEADQHENTNNDYTLWPNKGYFPIECIKNDIPWSIRLNQETVCYEKRSDIKINLTRLSDNRTWPFDWLDPQRSSENGKYMTTWMQTIIFRPDGIEQYNDNDIFEVHVTGLRAYNVPGDPESGTYDTELKYRIHFFSIPEIAEYYR
ncbi:MAG: hypothetical protein GX295_11670 [Syntrophomonadaceae bacterium]|nr:hypothetical protein [Syntrophomonadaceae bacterium]